MYKRKTQDEYNILQNTPEGWEIVNCENSYKLARESLKEYRDNQPEYEVKIKKSRVKISEVV